MSWFREVQFALRHTGNIRDAARLLVHTAHFHFANRGIVGDHNGLTSINITIRNQVRPLTFRTGRIGDLFIIYEILESEVYRISPTLVDPEEVRIIIDCGANIGVTSLYFASVYPAARIYSVEADPQSFALLKSNASDEPRIIPIYGCLVSASQGSVTFENGGPAWGRKIANSRGIRVPAITLDALIEERGIGRVDLLKMDIEGAEREILGAGEYLDTVQHLIAELHGGYSFSDFSSAVAPRGLQARLPDDNCKMITAHRWNIRTNTPSPASQRC